MGPLRRRASSVSETTFVATTVILLILFIAAVVAFVITFLRYIHRPRGVNIPLTPNHSRGFSHNNRTSEQQGPLQQRRPSNTRTYLPISQPSLYAATQSSPHHTYHGSVMPSLAPKQTLLPYHPNIPPASLAKPNSLEAAARDAFMARLAAMPSTSDTTDDTGFDGPGTEVMNRGYADWVARRRPQDEDPAAAMLIGSDEGTTDAGGGEAGNVGYAALLAKGEDTTDLDARSRREGLGGYGYSRDERRAGGDRAWRRFDGAVGSEGWRDDVVEEEEEEEEEDEEPPTPRPPPVALRKVRSDPY